MEKSFLEVLDREILDLQAELDAAEMYGGGDTYALEATLAEMMQARAEEHSRSSIMLEEGYEVPASPAGGWGRLHLVLYAVGPRNARKDEQFWTCTLCKSTIYPGERHHRRSYYRDKADNRTGQQVRLCADCAERHEIAFPPSTTFQVFRPAVKSLKVA